MTTVTARAALVAALLLAAGCSSGAPSAPANTATSAPTAANGSTGSPDPDADAGPATAEDAGPPTAQGDLAAPGRASNAFTYDSALAPEGAHVAVYVTPGPAQTRIRLVVEGLVPGRGYAAHAHAKACGATGDAAGPHFQNRPDPAAAPGTPSTDPAYANPQNEVWLDLHTDDDGDGESTAEVPFAFAAGHAPASVVIHGAETTMTAPGQAGSAGARLACLTVPLPT